MELILAIDQSTSATKAILFDKQGERRFKKSIEHSQIYPKSGWVEHDPIEIYENTLSVIEQLLSENSIESERIAAISITNQRETVVVWDKETGLPICNAIVWQCNRATHICKEIQQRGFAQLVKEKTGLVLSPFFSAAKVSWILENVDGAREKSENRKLLMGTIDSWLIWKLTEKRVHATDFSNASRTQLLNLQNTQWDDELLSIFDIPKSMLPHILPSDEIFGEFEINKSTSQKIPITGVMGDSHAALFGQKCFMVGDAKATYGTGSSIMMNIGSKVKISESGLVTSIGWKMKNMLCYCFEGNINFAGATIKWLVDELQLIKDPLEAEKLALSIDSNKGVYLVPAFSGLGAPYWNYEAKAIICGMSQNTTKAHIARAAEESIAYQVKDILEKMKSEGNVSLSELKVDGGPTRDEFLMQFQSDIVGTKILISKVEELSALGSAYMAGIAIGFWQGLNEINELDTKGRYFENRMDSKVREELSIGWKKAIEKALFSN